MSRALHDLSIVEASRLIADGEVSPVDLVQTLLDRIETHDGHLSSFVLVRAEAALAEAREAESEIARGCYRGPLHGIPLGVKDVIDTAGVRTTCGSRLRMDHVPERSATAWQRLKDAGGILLGKNETTEFAFGAPDRDGLYPPACNAWDRRHFGGGSSGGSCVAVATGLSLGAIGSDSGGSIRTPAALNGVVGLKPTFGRVSCHGVFPVSLTCDHCGTIARTAEDCAVLLGAIAGFDPLDPTSANVPVPDYRAALTEHLTGLRVGYVRHFSHEDAQASDEVNHAVESALTVLTDLGAEVIETRLPSLWDFTACNSTILMAEAYTIHERSLKERAREYTATTRDRLIMGAAIRASDYIQAQRLRRELNRSYAEALTHVDAIVCAGLLGTAPLMTVAAEAQKFYLIERPVLTAPFNATGAPAIATCCGFGATGLPIGMQIAGRWFDEATVLRIAHAYERATSWRERRPPLCEASPPLR